MAGFILGVAPVEVMQRLLISSARGAAARPGCFHGLRNERIRWAAFGETPGNEWLANVNY
jgi:hypothetical protein